MTEAQTRPYIGGQAVLEGVMMRSPGSLSIVCRRKSGELVVREQPMTATTKGPRTWPLVRGVATLVEALKLGNQALRWSANLYEEDLRLEDEAEAARAKKPPVLSVLALGLLGMLTQDGEVSVSSNDENKKKNSLGWVPLVFAVGMLVLLPQLLAEGVTRLFRLDLPVTSPAYQAITGAAKLTIIVVFYSLLRRTNEIYRVFQYHGAEHKAISTYEAREELIVENARKKTTMHARCGTTFVVMIVLVSIVAFTALGGVIPQVLPPIPGGRTVQWLVFFGLKLPFLPLIAAVTFEIQRVFARYCTTGPLRMLLWPGFLVQKITTAEPDDSQLEIAMASLRAALWRESAVEAPAPDDRKFPSYDALLADPGYSAAA
jgi:uncharacterized protein YqhQ